MIWTKHMNIWKEQSQKCHTFHCLKELYERKEQFDLSEISYMKQLVEEMMENNAGRA